VEWLKVKALSSNPSTTKNKKKKKKKRIQFCVLVFLVSGDFK
jgi:hypothetical protein